MVINIDERPEGSPRERDNPQRGEGRIHVAIREPFASENGHSARSGKREDEHARRDAIREPDLVERVDRHDDAADPLAQAGARAFRHRRPIWSAGLRPNVEHHGAL